MRSSMRSLHREITSTSTLSRNPCRTLTILLLCLCLQAGLADSLQFFLEARTKRCFREDIPLSTKAYFTYTIAQGSGAMPVKVRVRDGTGAVIYEKAEADHDVHSFRTPDQIPNVKQRSDWSLHDDDKQDDEAFFRQYPNAVGDDRVGYLVCFEHSWLHMPHLSMRDAPVKRRIIFNMGYGFQMRDRSYYDALAKENHLSSTEELFRVVEDRVTDIVRMVDEMRQRDLRMTHVTARTSRSVALYSILACLVIAAGGAITSYSSLRYMTVDKRLR